MTTYADLFEVYITYKDVEGIADAVLTGETHFKVK